MRIINLILFGGMLTALRMATGFIVTKFIAIYAGPSGVALAGQLQSFILGVNGIITTQVSKGIVRYTATHKDDGYESCGEWWSASVTLIFMMLGVIIPLFCVFSPLISDWLFYNKSLYWIIVIATISLPLNAVNSVLLATLNGLGENKKNISTSMISICVSTFISLLLLFILDINGALIAIAINNALSGIIVLIRVRHYLWFNYNFWIQKADKQKIKLLSGYLLMGIVGAVTGPTALVIIRNMITETFSLVEAGWWQSVWRISSAYIAMITLGVSMYYFPKASKINNSSELLKETRKVILIVLPAGMISAIIIFYCREFLIELLFSGEFSSASELFKPQLIGDVFRMVSFVPACIILARGYFEINIGAEVISNVGLVLLSYIFIPGFGLIGVNYAYAVVYILYAIFSFLFLKYHCSKLRSRDD